MEALRQEFTDEQLEMAHRLFFSIPEEDRPYITWSLKRVGECRLDGDKRRVGGGQSLRYIRLNSREEDCLCDFAEREPVC
jgi:hypothetical protein